MFSREIKIEGDGSLSLHLKEIHMFITGHAGISLGFLSLVMGSKNRKMGLQGLNPWIVAFFAILPDIIDKPIAIFFLSDPQSWRLYAHSLSFFIFLQISINLFYRKWQTYGFFSLGHLLLDGMWNQPHTLFYPFLGFQFDSTPGPKVGSITNYFHWNLDSILSDPFTVIAEFIGFAGILLYIIKSSSIRS